MKVYLCVTEPNWHIPLHRHSVHFRQTLVQNYCGCWLLVNTLGKYQYHVLYHFPTSHKYDGGKRLKHLFWMINTLQINKLNRIVPIQINGPQPASKKARYENLDVTMNPAQVQTNWLVTQSDSLIHGHKC